MCENEVVADDVCKRSVAVDDELRYVMYVYLQHDKSAMTKKCSVNKFQELGDVCYYNLQAEKLLGLFEWLPGPIVFALEITKPLSFRAVVELNKYEQVLESSTDPETPVSSPIKWKDTFFLQVCIGSVMAFTIMSPFHEREVLYY